MIRVFLPLLGYALASIEYFLLPNVRENAFPERYFIVLTAGIVAYSAFALFSFLRKDKGLRLFNRLSYRAPIFCAVYVFLALFDVLTLKTGRLTYPFIPWFNDIINSAVADWPMLLKSTLFSLRLLLVSYVVGALAGVATGVVAGYSKSVRYWIEPVLNVLGPIPPATWIPLSMILAKTLFSGSVFIIALGVWYNVSLSTLIGVMNVKKEHLDSARILGASELQIVFRVVIPSSLPSIFQGLSSGMTSACITLIIAEMIGVEAGLGWYIEWAKAWAMFNRMYVAIITICVLFNLVNFTLKKCKRHFLRWENGN